MKIFELGIFALLLQISMQQANNATNATTPIVCIVDQCRTCPNSTAPICTECNSGYYLKTFTAYENKPYNDCWWSNWLYLSYFGFFVFFILNGLTCFGLYKLGETKWRSRGGHKDTEFMLKERYKNDVDTEGTPSHLISHRQIQVVSPPPEQYVIVE